MEPVEDSVFGVVAKWGAVLNDPFPRRRVGSSFEVAVIDRCFALGVDLADRPNGEKVLVRDDGGEKLIFAVDLDAFRVRSAGHCSAAFRRSIAAADSSAFRPTAATTSSSDGGSHSSSSVGVA
jgi:hypothetical protein